jgi:hypothetical protein
MVQRVISDLLRSTECVLVLKFMLLHLYEFISSCISSIFLLEIICSLTIRWYKPCQEKVRTFHLQSVLILLFDRIKHHHLHPYCLTKWIPQCNNSLLLKPSCYKTSLPPSRTYKLNRTNQHPLLHLRHSQGTSIRNL